MMKYYLYGDCRKSPSEIPTDRLPDSLRSYGTCGYYGARYYDPEIGRFISPDPITHTEPLPKGKIISGLTVYVTSTEYYTGQSRSPRYINPQQHNRYSYVLNNPLKYIDPDGHQFYEALAQWENYLAQLMQSLPPEAKIVIGIGMVVVGIVYTVSYAVEEPEVIVDVASTIIDEFRTGWSTWWADANNPVYEEVEEPTHPDYNYPGENPNDTVEGEWEWHGGDEGSWYNSETGESLRPAPKDEYHGPHYDYTQRHNPYQWRIYPDGSWELKQ